MTPGYFVWVKCNCVLCCTFFPLQIVYNTVVVHIILEADSEIKPIENVLKLLILAKTVKLNFSNTYLIKIGG